jgi:hypothetical protein
MNLGQSREKNKNSNCMSNFFLFLIFYWPRLYKMGAKDSGLQALILQQSFKEENPIPFTVLIPSPNI